MSTEDTRAMRRTPPSSTSTQAGTEQAAASSTLLDPSPPPVGRVTDRRVEQHTEHHENPVTVNVPGPSGDQVRWGPVWAGLVVALSTFVLLELAFFALGWLTPGDDDAGAGAQWMSGLVGLLAFLLGGLTAGATAVWRSARTGLLHGVLVWALGVAAFLLLTVLGGGALFGSLADALTQASALRNAATGIDVNDAVASSRDAASWAVLGLGLSVTAAALGGVLGAKMWPRRHQSDVRGE